MSKCNLCDKPCLNDYCEFGSPKMNMPKENTVFLDRNTAELYLVLSIFPIATGDQYAMLLQTDDKKGVAMAFFDRNIDFSRSNLEVLGEL